MLIINKLLIFVLISMLFGCGQMLADKRFKEEMERRREQEKLDIISQRLAEQKKQAERNEQYKKRNLKGMCIGNCIDGEGALTNEEGYEYIGEFKNGDISKGTVDFHNGGKYVGEFKDFGFPDGQGVSTYANGTIFTGIHHNGYAWNGIYVLKNGKRLTSTEFRKKAEQEKEQEEESNRNSTKKALTAWAANTKDKEKTSKTLCDCLGGVVHYGFVSDFCYTTSGYNMYAEDRFRSQGYANRLAECKKKLRGKNGKK